MASEVAAAESQAGVGGHVYGIGSTLRTDRWWIGPTVTFSALMLAIIYMTWAAFQAEHYWVGTDAGANGVAVSSDGFGGYLSPLYSPVLFANDDTPGSAPSAHGWLAESFPSWWPGFLPMSPAFLILMFPGSFRFTCYYYRKAYYRSFVATPLGCAVEGRPQKRYQGETRLLLIQNLHRYAMYFAVIFIFILSFDAIQSFFRDGAFGVGVGSLVLCINVALLGSYTFGCHSWRHLIGGRLNCFSCDGLAKKRYGAYQRVSWLNSKHMRFAWLSLFWVTFTDIYVRLVSMGVWTDLSTW